MLEARSNFLRYLHMIEQQCMLHCASLRERRHLKTSTFVCISMTEPSTESECVQTLCTLPVDTSPLCTSVRDSMCGTSHQLHRNTNFQSLHKETEIECKERIEVLNKRVDMSELSCVATVFSCVDKVLDVDIDLIIPSSHSMHSQCPRRPGPTGDVQDL